MPESFLTCYLCHLSLKFVVVWLQKWPLYLCPLQYNFEDPSITRWSLCLLQLLNMDWLPDLLWPTEWAMWRWLFWAYIVSRAFILPISWNHVMTWEKAQDGLLEDGRPGGEESSPSQASYQQHSPGIHLRQLSCEWSGLSNLETITDAWMLLSQTTY